MDKEVQDNDLLDALNAGEGDDVQQQGDGVRADGKLGDLSEKVEQPSVRDSIREAIKTESKSPEEKAEERNKNLEKAREVRKVKRTSDLAGDTNKDALDKTPIGGKENVNKDVSSSKSDVQPPNGWTKEAKALWNQLPDHIKQSVAKREKETSDGFKTYGEKAKKYDELEAVISPRRESIQRFGVSEAQTVDRLFQWMEALTGPNKFNSWLMLGQNFGIDVNQLRNQLGSQPTNTPTQQQQKPAVQQPNDEIKSYVDTKLSAVEQYLAQQKQEAANGILTNWAKDKPHFQKVRVSMFGLLNSGAVPLKDGNLDLDTAYDYACNANPEIRAELTAKAQEDSDNKAAEDRQKAEADRIIRVNKAKNAGVSIRPTAPTGGEKSKSTNRKLNGPSPSARDSIRDAIAELVGQ